MVQNNGNLLPIYFLADESASMEAVLDDLNGGLARLHEALLGEPMAAAKVRFSILGFSYDVQVRLELADLRYENELPLLQARGATDYGAAFRDLRTRIPADIQALKARGYTVHRPGVFFLSDGMPTDGDGWRVEYQQLIDRAVTVGAPNIIAFGIGAAQPHTILEVATQPEYAFLAVPESNLATAIATFCTALTKSVVQSGQTLGSSAPMLVVERPESFTMVIDVV